MAMVSVLVALVMMVGNVCRKAEKSPMKAVDASLGLVMVGIGEAHREGCKHLWWVCWKMCEKARKSPQKPL